MAAKKAMVQRQRFLKIYSLKFCDIWQNFCFYRFLNDENFKMEVEQATFVTHLIITNENMICVAKKTQKKIMSSRWNLNPQPSTH